MKARYTVTTIVTSDEKVISRSAELRKKVGVTHEDIYRRGLEWLEAISTNTPTVKK